ncbi:hypothetical protein [Streptomyces sp. NPDC002516]
MFDDLVEVVLLLAAANSGNRGLEGVEGYVIDGIGFFARDLT